MTFNIYGYLKYVGILFGRIWPFFKKHKAAKQLAYCGIKVAYLDDFWSIAGLPEGSLKKSEKFHMNT